VNIGNPSEKLITPEADQTDQPNCQNRNNIRNNPPLLHFKTITKTELDKVFSSIHPKKQQDMIISLIK